MDTETALSTFQQASFRGIPFLFNSSTQSGGRKYKIFEYPNRDYRFTEDLGLLQKRYRLHAVISDPSSTYVNARDRFISALNEEGEGVLIHPIDGEVTVFALPYRLLEDKKEIGLARFELNFVETRKQSGAISVLNSYASIIQNLTNYVEGVRTTFNLYWKFSSNYPNNVLFGFKVVNDVYESFSRLLDLASNTESGYSNYSIAVESLNLNAGQYVNNSVDYNNQINDIFSFIYDLSEDNFTRLDYLQLFFQYKTSTDFSNVTIQTNERLKAYLMNDQLINSQAFIYYCSVISDMDFNTDVEILQQKSVIETQYNYIISSNEFFDIYENKLQLLDEDTLELIKSILFSVMEGLNQKLVNVDKVINYDIKLNSLLPEVYSLYNDVDLFEKILKLNNIIYPFGLSETIKIVQ